MNSMHIRSGGRLLLGAVLLLALAGLVTACGGSSGGSSESTDAGSTEASSEGSSDEKKLVYFMAPNTQPDRYIHQDGPDFVESMKKLDPSAQVQQEVADGTSATQQSQVETAIANGADVLVIVAADPPSSGGLLEVAANAGVPVIGYENPPLEGPVTSQALFSPLSAGQHQGKYFAQQVESGELGSTPVPIIRLYGNKGDTYTTEMLKGQNQYLQPLIDEGKVSVECENYVKEWDPKVAQTDMEQCLSKAPDVRAYLGFYDGDVAGAIAALEQRGLRGKVKVYGGQNPELSGLQYLLTEDLQDEVYKPYPILAEGAAELAVAALNGEEPPAELINAHIDNGAESVTTYEIPTRYGHQETGVNPADLVQKAVDWGMFTWQEVCTGEAASTQGCKENG